jgi:hypothetical protein
MNLIGRISDEEVSVAIRYLDPELPEGWEVDEKDKTEMRSGCQAKIACMVSSLGIIVWITAVRYIPTISQLLNQRFGLELFR